MQEEKKENFSKISYILIIFSFCCAMIYFKNSIISIILGLIALLFIFLFNKLNKKYTFFIFLLLACFITPTNEVKALDKDYTPSVIKNYVYNYLIGEDGYDDYSQDEYKYFFYYSYLDENGNPVDDYKYHFAFSVCDFEYTYDFKTNVFGVWPIGLDCGNFTTFSFNDDLVLNELGRPIGGTYMETMGPAPDFDLSNNDLKVYYADKDIIFNDDKILGVDNQLVFYRVQDNSVYDEFGNDLSNVEGYSYYTLSSGSQVVLYPKTLKAFDFYLLYLNGGLAVDILDTVGSNIYTSEHQEIINEGSNKTGFQYKQFFYSQEDANNKRGIYLTNFRADSLNIQFAFKSNLFEILTFNENGLATTKDGSVTFSNTYNLIKDKNNIVDSNDELGSFDDMISNPKNLASQLVGVFQTIGQLVTIFFSSMPEFISQGLTLLFVIVIAIAILKALL